MPVAFPFLQKAPPPPPPPDVAPVIGAQSFEIDPDSVNGTTVGTVLVTNSPYPTSLTFAIASGNGAGAFEIDAPTGRIDVLSQTALATLTDTTVVLGVTVSNGVSPDGSASISILVQQPQISAVITSFDVKNTGGSTVNSGTFFTQMVALDRGAVPPNTRIVLLQNDGTTEVSVQQDQESYWNDGSTKLAALSFLLPNNITAGSTETFKVAYVAEAPNRTAVCTLANLAADTDFNIASPAWGDLADAATTSVNDIITDGTAWPWGSSPLYGYEVIREGPVCCEWRFWSYKKRDSDGAFHRWVKDIIWVRALSSTGPYEVIGRTTQDNLFGAHSGGTWGATGSQPRHAFQCELRNGATVIRAYGTANDTRAVTTAQTNLTAASGSIAVTHGFGIGAPFRVESDDTLPTGDISVDNTYFTHGYGEVTTSLRLNRHRQATQGNDTVSAWQASHYYSVGTYVSNSSAIYVCVTAGTSASSGGPSGSGSSIADGGAAWENVTAVSTDTGTGNFTLYPVCCTFPHTGFAIATDKAEPFWIASGVLATRPTLLGKQDLTYLFGSSKALPPYIDTLTFSTVGSPNTLRICTPAALNSGSVWDLNATGASVGDERFEYINPTAVKAFYNATDPGSVQNARVLGLSWLDSHFQGRDQSSGKVPITNRGPAKDGVTYPDFPAVNYTLVMHPHNAGSPAPSSPSTSKINNDGYYERYGVWIDQSHLPSRAYGPYLLTGNHIFLEIMEDTLNWSINNNNVTSRVVAGTTYYKNVWKVAQVRGVGRLLRTLGQVTHAMFGPTTDYWNDMIGEQSDYISAWIADKAGDTGMALGLHPVFLGDDAPGSTGLRIAAWQYHISYASACIEAWRNDHAGFLDFAENHGNLLTVDSLSSDAGGCSWIANQVGAGSYDVLIASSSSPWTPYATWAAAQEADHGAGYCAASGFAYNDFGVSGSASNSQANQAAYAITMACVLGVTNAANARSEIRARQSAESTMFASDPTYALEVV